MRSCAHAFFCALTQKSFGSALRLYNNMVTPSLLRPACILEPPSRSFDHDLQAIAVGVLAGLRGLDGPSPLS